MIPPMNVKFHTSSNFNYYWSKSVMCVCAFPGKRAHHNFHILIVSKITNINILFLNFFSYYWKASKWTQAAEKLLLVKHKDLEDSKVPIKQKWKKISDDMHSFNYFFTPEQCRLKLKSMKEKYDRNKKKNNKSGESPADSDDEELEEIFEKLPDMNPVCLIESNPSKSQTSTDQRKHHLSTSWRRRWVRLNYPALKTITDIKNLGNIGSSILYYYIIHVLNYMIYYYIYIYNMHKN